VLTVEALAKLFMLQKLTRYLTLILIER